MREQIARVERFVGGERISTLYVLPPKGALNPLRDDVRALLSLLNRKTNDE